MPPQYDRLSGIIIRSNLGAVGCSAAKWWGGRIRGKLQCTNRRCYFFYRWHHLSPFRDDTRNRHLVSIHFWENVKRCYLPALKDLFEQFSDVSITFPRKRRFQRCRTSQKSSQFLPLNVVKGRTRTLVPLLLLANVSFFLFSRQQTTLLLSLKKKNLGTHSLSSQGVPKTRSRERLDAALNKPGVCCVYWSTLFRPSQGRERNKGEQQNNHQPPSPPIYRPLVYYCNIVCLL